MGAANKVSGYQITRIKVLKKKSPKSCDVFIKGRFFPSICILNIYPEVFIYQLPLFLHGCKHPLFHVFSTVIGLFSGDVFV